MSKINKSILAALLAQPAFVRGDYFGAPGSYNSNERVANAGTTWRELHDAGVSLQGDTQDRYSATNTVAKDGKITTAERFSRIREYYLNHGGALMPDTRANAEYRYPDGKCSVGHVGHDYRVNPKTCPSGLRPRIIRASHTADQVAAWHEALRLAVANTPDGGAVDIPALSDNGTSADIPNSPRPAKTPRTGSAGWHAFDRAREGVLIMVSNLCGALRAADDPSRTGPLSDRIAAHFGDASIWGSLMEVSPSDFDTNTIREGSLVSPVPGSKAQTALAFMARVSKLDKTPETLTVVSIDGTNVAVSAEGFKRPVPCALADLRRYVAPPPVTAVAFTATPGCIAVVEDVQGMVLSITGETAVFITDEGDEVEVPVKDLRAPTA